MNTTLPTVALRRNAHTVCPSIVICIDAASWYAHCPVFSSRTGWFWVGDVNLGVVSTQTWDDNTSALSCPLHSFICWVCESKDMRRSLINFSALVIFDNIIIVYVEWFVWVDRHNHLTNVCVYAWCVISKTTYKNVRPSQYYYLDYKKQENSMALIPTGSNIVGQSLYFANNPFSSFSFHVELILVGR